MRDPLKNPQNSHSLLFSFVTPQLPTQRTCYIDAEVLLVASTVELRISKGVTKLGRRILQSDLHNKTFCKELISSAMCRPTSLLDRGLAGGQNGRLRN